MPEILRPKLVSDALAEAGRGNIDLSGLWIALKSEKIVGALLTHTLAGRALAVWAPEVVPVWGRANIAVPLLRSALEDAKNRGFLIAQALVDHSSPRCAARDLSYAGMPRITQLVYMARSTEEPLSLPTSTPRFVWSPFETETEGDFRSVLNQTYRQSLDMPELEGVRSLDDVITAHRAGGRYNPEQWKVGHLPNEPEASAVILLSDQPDRNLWEVSYLGVSPQARGRGLGRAALAEAIELARPHSPKLVLAVDSRNKPAYRLYRKAGFEPFDRRAVHLKILNRQS